MWAAPAAPPFQTDPPGFRGHRTEAPPPPMQDLSGPHASLYENRRALLKLSAVESACPRPEAAEAGGRQAGRGRQGSRGRGAEAEAGRREEAKEGRRRGRETDDTDTQTQTSRTEPFHPLPPPMRASARPATCCDKRSHFLLKPQAIPTREPQ